jgi:antitoxin ParD1/3/4
MLKANVKITGRLEEFTRAQINESGLYETTSEYLRDLIRQDMERKNAKVWLSLRDELLPGMKAPRSAFVEVTAADVINRNKPV